MIYLAIQCHYEGDSILGAARSLDGAKRIVERSIREWKSWGDLTWIPSTERWEDDDEMQEYLRRSGRRVATVNEEHDYCIRVIEQVED